MLVQRALSLARSHLCAQARDLLLQPSAGGTNAALCRRHALREICLRHAGGLRVASLAEAGGGVRCGLGKRALRLGLGYALTAAAKRAGLARRCAELI